MVTQSDPGSENYGVANGHTMLRQWYDPLLEGTLQHRWMRQKKNVMPEIAWSQLRRRFTPGFEALLERGVNSGWYDTNNTLQVMIFRWVFIPWLQVELNAYRDRVNNTAKRRDRNKILPHGGPNLIYESAEDYGALDFKIKVEQDAIDHVRKVYINPTHPVFDLVPKLFGEYVQHWYNVLGCPPITRQLVWDVYLQLLGTLRGINDLPPMVLTLEDEDEIFVPLLEGYEELPFRQETNGSYYMGGVNGGLGLGPEHVHQLDILSREDDGTTSLGISEDMIGLDGAGLVVWDWSDDEGSIENEDADQVWRE